MSAINHALAESFISQGEEFRVLFRQLEDHTHVHAYLITGEKGTGKRTLARLMCAYLLCNSENGRPCGICRNCSLVEKSEHPDVILIEQGASISSGSRKERTTIPVDDIREMIRLSGTRSPEGNGKVALIFNADKLTVQAQNCLLKTLEETADDTYFLLTCDIESAILPTIRSRCRCVRVQPWNENRIEQTLLKRGIPGERARALSLYCEGSLGRALQMQEDASYWQARETVRKSFLSVQGTAQLPAAAQALKDQKDSGDKLLDILEQEIRALLHAKALGAEDVGDDFPPLWQNATPQALRAILEAIFTARKQRNANVGWAALSEGLLQTISEETTAWQA